MFVEAIETAAAFTRPLHTISRNYSSTTVLPGAATLFFVNADGWALTCRHVAEHLLGTEKANGQWEAFKKERAELRGHKREKQLVRELEQKYGYSKQMTVEIRNRFMNCIEGDLHLKIIAHDKVDLALLKFERYPRLLCSQFPVFPPATPDLKQGKYLCRLGFPFPEFTDFAYDPETDSIKWTEDGKHDTPRFPIEGMVTRHLVNDQGQIVGFEMSTPGLRGQSGGPAFDLEGKVWGIQCQTAHLDLNFDVGQDVFRAGVKKHVTDSAFLHVGHCVHIDVIKAFMKEHAVNFNEG